MRKPSREDHTHVYRYRSSLIPNSFISTRTTSPYSPYRITFSQLRTSSNSSIIRQKNLSHIHQLFSQKYNPHLQSVLLIIYILQKNSFLNQIVADLVPLLQLLTLIDADLQLIDSQYIPHSSSGICSVLT